MKIVYVAGPYGDAGGYLAIDRNIAKAREAAAWLADNGIGFFCPHLNSAHFECITSQPNTFWRELDIRFISACDAMLLLDGYENSEGSKAELAIAIKCEMPVFVFFDGETGSGESALLLEWARA